MSFARPKSPVRILIVDDHPAVREALAFRIGMQSDLEVCGEAADIQQALALVDSTKPDVAIIDLSLKNESGIELIKRIKDRAENVLILVWSMHDDMFYAERALRAGALGYINKHQATDKTVEAIRRVLSGKVYLSEEIAEKLLHRSVGDFGIATARCPIDVLADRELEVFRHIGQGMKTRNIATVLHLSVKTVETYRDRIRLKLLLRDGSELLHYATQWIMENG